MTPEARRLTQLAARVRRQRLGFALLVLTLLVIVSAALTVSGFSLPVRVILTLAFALLCAALLYARSPIEVVSPVDYAHHLDALLPALQDSSELLLRDPDSLSGLTAIARQHAAARFDALDRQGSLAQTIPAFGWRPLIAVGVTGAVLITLGLAWPASAPAPDAATPPLERLVVVDATVRQTPPAYLNLAQSTSPRLDFATVENASIAWDITLSERVESALLKFHDGETLALTTSNGRRFRSPDWTARSSVYQLLVEERATPVGVYRIDAQADLAPSIDVALPEQSLRTLTGATDEAQMRLRFVARDDHQIVNAVGKVTLARGSGEQVRFREQDLPLVVNLSADRQQAVVDQNLDLLELGMTPGDELYLFVEVTDNEPDQPNVGTSGTYIVRWPGEEARSGDPQATLAVAVMPEFFRSQRQIIIDTETLLRERLRLSADDFAQRAQSLAADQKLLRLRYGQYLGEEDDSGIGRVGAPIEEEDDDADDDHDHAGHADESAESATPVFGDAAAAIAPYAHFHDRAEQATLFDPKTSGDLRAALSNMWDAELQLRLAQPQPALPFEYAALKHLKAVQQSSRIYLRRVGFRPTPVDESRRLSAQLDDIVERPLEHSIATAGEQAQMRALVSELVRIQPAPDRIDAPLSELINSIGRRAERANTWLPLLGALQRFAADRACATCREQLVGALWRSLDRSLAAPGAARPASDPLVDAYQKRMATAQ